MDISNIPPQRPAVVWRIKSLMLISLLIPMIQILFCTLVQAGPDTFACVVTSAHVVSEEGKLVTDTEFLKSQIGLTFSVDRATGAIRGGGNLSNASMKDIKVINEPKDSGYFIISISYHPKVYYMYIANHRKSEKKPFTYALHGEYIYSGYCH